MSEVVNFIKVRVTLERRADGGLRAYSDDVPGLHLSHYDPSLVLMDVIPALETLFEHNEKLRVKFGPVTTARAGRGPAAGDALPSIGGQVVREYVAPVGTLA